MKIKNISKLKSIYNSLEGMKIILIFTLIYLLNHFYIKRIRVKVSKRISDPLEKKILLTFFEPVKNRIKNYPLNPGWSGL